MAKDLGVFPADAKSLFTEEISSRLGEKYNRLLGPALKVITAESAGKSDQRR